MGLDHPLPQPQRDKQNNRTGFQTHVVLDVGLRHEVGSTAFFVQTEIRNTFRNRNTGVARNSIPAWFKGSPQLNVRDYALWAEVNKRMRRQERRWPASRKETRKQYLTRLRRTAMRLPASFINESIGNMRTRTQRLKAAKGKHFEEGGV